ncbi:TolC family protein [Rhodocaloribacter sp.]
MVNHTLSRLSRLAMALGLGIALMSLAPAHGQERPLSLREALERAQHRNFDVRRAQADARAAQAEAHQALAAFLPQLSISESATTTNDPLNAFGFKLRREIVTQADFNPALLNDPGRTDLITTRFEFRQPVLNPDGLFRQRAARRQARAAVYGVERTRHYVAFQVKQKYYALVLARRSLAVIDAALAAARANRAQADRFFEQGLITRADKLEAGVRVLDLESKHSGAVIAVRNASDELRYLLGIEEDVTLAPTDGLEPRPVPLGDVDVQAVNRNRSDMQALRLRTEAARQALRAGRLRFLPRLNVFGSYDLNDRALFGANGRSWTFGATLQWNLFDGFRQIAGIERAKADLRKSRIALQDQTLRNQVEIEAARRGIEQTRRQLELAQAAVAQARENLRIRTDRYAQGLEKTTDVLNAEVMLANQELAHLETLYRYYVNVFQLELLLERPLFTE